MAKFIDAYNRTVMNNEGPYDNDPHDPGGETIFGITRKYSASWAGWKHFDAMKPLLIDREAIVKFVLSDQALQLCIEEFYERGPWADIRGNDIQSQVIAEELFDSGVNCGTGTAIKWLQRALNIFNRGAKDYPDIKVDGNFGLQTLECLNALLGKRPGVGERILLRCLNSEQGQHYMTIAESNANLEDFEVGWWSNRVS